MSKIRVYIKSKKTMYEIPTQGLMVKGHPCYGFKKEVIIKLPDDHERIKKMAEEVTKEQGIDIEIYDLTASFKGRISAFLRGIKAPSIEIGNKRVNGILNKERLLTLLIEKVTLETSHFRRM